MKSWPFVILGLPRSRTAWLSHWLGGPKGPPIGHDLCIGASSVLEALDRLWLTRIGTCETAAAEAAPVIARAMPGVRIVTIRRTREAVAASLMRFGLFGLEPELARRDTALDAAERLPGATRIDYNDLTDPRCASWLWEHLRGEPFDFRWWEFCDVQNIQVNMQERLAALRAAEPQAIALREDLTKQLASPTELIRVGLESWTELAEEILPLLTSHWSEAGARPTFPVSPNTAILSQLNSSGALPIISARADGRLIGYICASVGPDVESLGVLQAQQGTWFVSPGFPGVGMLLLTRLRLVLRNMGVKALYLHSPMTGRGAKLPKLFTRLGAQPYQQVYCLENP